MVKILGLSENFQKKDRKKNYVILHVIYLSSFYTVSKVQVSTSPRPSVFKQPSQKSAHFWKVWVRAKESMVPNQRPETKQAV